MEQSRTKETQEEKTMIDTSDNNLPDHIFQEIDEATKRFRRRRMEIETRKYEQRQNKALRDRGKKTASEQQIAVAEKRARFKERDRIIVLLHDTGQTFKSIGLMLSISGNRVRQVFHTRKRREKMLAEDKIHDRRRATPK